MSSDYRFLQREIDRPERPTKSYVPTYKSYETTESIFDVPSPRENPGARKPLLPESISELVPEEVAEQVAPKREFERRYVYNLTDLENMNDQAVRRFADLFKIQYDRLAKRKVIKVLDESGLVVRIDRPISPYQSEAIKINITGNEGKENLNVFRIFPASGIFYLDDVNLESHANWLKSIRDAHKNQEILDRYMRQFTERWEEFDNQILSKRLTKTQDLAKIVSERLQHSIVRSTKTIARVLNVPPTGFFRKTMPERRLQVFLNDNTLVIVPVNNRLAGVPHIVGEEQNYNFSRTDYPQVRVRKLDIQTIPDKTLDIPLPANDIYLFCFPKTVKKFIYDGPVDQYSHLRAAETNDYLYSTLQNFVQLAIDSSWAVEDLTNKIYKMVQTNYQKYGHRSDNENGNLIVIYLPCLAPADCWKTSVEYLLEKLGSLPENEKQITTTPEISSIFSTCDAAWSTLPYDQRRDWCQRIARIYRILLQVSFNAETEPYFMTMQIKTRYLSKIGVNSWLKPENKETIEQAIQEMEARVNELTSRFI